MIESWQVCANFQTTSQRLADQIRTIIKKGWVSDLEIQKIHQKINIEQNSKTVPGTSSINKRKQPNRKEPPTSENGKSTQSNNTQPSNPEQTLTQEQKLSLENLMRNMNCEKTTLP